MKDKKAAAASFSVGRQLWSEKMTGQQLFRAHSKKT